MDAALAGLATPTHAALHRGQQGQPPEIEPTDRPGPWPPREITKPCRNWPTARAGLGELLIDIDAA